MRKPRELKQYKCEICGKEFLSRSNRVRFCKECGIEHEKQRKLEWARKKYNYKPKTKCTEPCCICGGTFSCYFDGKPYCNKHWLRMYTHGTPEKLKRQSTNKYIDHDDYTSVICKNGEEILVDNEDLDKIKDHSWCISKTGYAVANVNGKTVKMHRYLLGLTDPKEVVDHKNHNTLDNRRENIRVCTQYENSKNHSGKKDRDLPVGVIIAPSGRYHSTIFVDGRTISLGTFDTLEEAVEARNEGELKYCGKFAQHLSKDYYL